MIDSSELAMQQTSGVGRGVSEGRIFKKAHVYAGAKECCPYDNYMCSQKKDRNYPVAFWISASNNGGITHGDRHEVGCPAGGYITVTGTRDAMTFNSYDANHNRL
ncbi:hypothetical protein BDC45DRAFT_566207 [Circinella umbellata]|nr:hypothetical protein BDC45DRAFT_566207 [Circinella umbellata]